MARPRKPWYRKERGEWFVTINGKKTPLGVKDPKSLGAAWAAMQALLAGIDGDGNEGEPVAAMVPAYLDAIAYRVEAATVKKYRGDLAWLTALYGTVQINRLVPEEIERRAASEPWSDSHRCNVLYTIQSFVRWAGVTTFRLSRPAKESRGADSVIPLPVYERILRETTGDFHQYIRVLWATGARPSEAMTLSVESVDWVNGSVTLKKHKMKKKGKVRTVHFSPDAIKVLVEQREKYGTGFLFRGVRGERLTLRAVTDRFIRLSKKIGHHVSAYCFRHTACTRLLAMGVSDAQVAALLGHSSTTMIHKHYSHLGSQSRLLADVAAKLDDAA